MLPAVSIIRSFIARRQKILAATANAAVVIDIAAASKTTAATVDDPSLI